MPHKLRVPMWFLASVGTAGWVVIGLPGTAHADTLGPGSASGGDSGGSVTASVSAPGTPGAAPGPPAALVASAGTDNSCAPTPGASGSELPGPGGDTNGSWWMVPVGCPTPPDGPGVTRVPMGSTGAGLASVWVPAAQPAPAVVDPAVLARQALASAPFPAVRIGTNPPSGRLAVNFPVWLFVAGGWAPVSASAAAGPVSATVTAAPTSVVWSTGDGASVTCTGPGAPYDPSRTYESQVPPPCGYTYRRSSAVAPGAVLTLTATVTWAVTWAAAGAPGGGALPAVSRSSSVPVSVGEVQVLDQ